MEVRSGLYLKVKEESFQKGHFSQSTILATGLSSESMNQNK